MYVRRWQYCGHEHDTVELDLQPNRHRLTDRMYRDLRPDRHMFGIAVTSERSGSDNVECGEPLRWQWHLFV